MIDGFDGLRLNTFGGGDDEHDDIRHIGAAGAHGGEGLVAGRVDEGDPFAIQIHHPGGGVLGNATGLAGGDVGLADAIEKAGFSVIDMAEDGDDGRTDDQVGFFGGPGQFVFQFFLQRCGSDDLKLDVVFQGQSLSNFSVEGRIDASHDALFDKLGLDFIALDAEGGGESFDGNRFLNLDRLAALNDALGLGVMGALGAFQMAVEAGAIGGRVAQTNAPLFQIGFGIFLELFHGFATAAVGATAAGGKGAAFAALFLVGVLAFFVGRLDPPAALGAGLHKAGRHGRLGQAGTLARRGDLLWSFFADDARALNRRGSGNVFGGGWRSGLALGRRGAAAAVVDGDGRPHGARLGDEIAGCAGSAWRGFGRSGGSRSYGRGCEGHGGRGSGRSWGGGSGWGWGLNDHRRFGSDGRGNLFDGGGDGLGLGRFDFGRCARCDLLGRRFLALLELDGLVVEERPAQDLERLHRRGVGATEGLAADRLRARLPSPSAAATLRRRVCTARSFSFHIR